MIKTVASVMIARPVPEVFAYSTRIAHFPTWFRDVVREARQTSTGPLAAGTTFTLVAEFLGRRIELLFAVTAYEPDRRFCIATRWGVLPFEGCFHYEPAAGGTLLTDRHSIGATGLFDLVGSLLVARLRQQAETNLANLKRILEASSAG